jgi:hypothetical protein
VCVKMIVKVSSFYIVEVVNNTKPFKISPAFKHELQMEKNMF